MKLNCMAAKRRKNTTHAAYYYDDEFDDKVEHVRKKNSNEMLSCWARVRPQRASIQQRNEEDERKTACAFTVRMVENIYRFLSWLRSSLFRWDLWLFCWTIFEFFKEIIAFSNRIFSKILKFWFHSNFFWKNFEVQLIFIERESRK